MVEILIVDIIMIALCYSLFCFIFGIKTEPSQIKDETLDALMKVKDRNFYLAFTFLLFLIPFISLLAGFNPFGPGSIAYALYLATIEINRMSGYFDYALSRN